MATYIGAAILGFVLLGIGSLALVVSGELDSYLSARKSDLGRDAARVLDSEDLPGLRAWLQTPNNIPAGVSLFVLDEYGKDVGGRELPAIYKNFVARFVLPSQSDRREPDNYRPLRLAPQLIAPDGKAYAFLLVPARVAPWGSFASLGALIAAALVVIAVIAALIARAFSSPLGELQVAVKELAGGRTSARAPDALSERRDELGDLARDFNAMAIRLEAVLNTRQQLMRDMSHELRSPLARLQAALALMESKQALPAAEHARIVEEIGRMDRAIGDALRLSKLETAPIANKHLLKIDRLLAELVHDEQVEAEARGVRLELQTETDLETVGDPALLRSGFENVLRNAIRYAPGSSTVQVRTQHNAAGQIEVDIEDRGPGVAPPLLERIFEPYTRFAADANDARGSGLGLAIARRVFELHGGTIAASPAQPCGLRVSMRLPAAC
jgi:two-component system sensor histidine kinase CpxA